MHMILNHIFAAFSNITSIVFFHPYAEFAFFMACAQNFRMSTALKASTKAAATLFTFIASEDGRRAETGWEIRKTDMRDKGGNIQ